MADVKVAVMNTSKEITEILQEALEDEGFKTASIYTYVLKNEEDNFDNFIKDNSPSVIVYDIALPYEENYELFKRVKKRKSAEGIKFILTTTNKEVLEKLVGQTDAIEIIGKPFDLEEVTKAVKSAL